MVSCLFKHHLVLSLLTSTLPSLATGRRMNPCSEAAGIKSRLATPQAEMLERTPAHTCARTVQAKPHMALSGVLCSRPLRISKEKVTVSPST